MKLLYFGSERLDAQHLATSLRAITQDGATVSWTASADRASAWIAQNKDLAALVIETQIEGASWHALLTCVRGLVPCPAVIAIAPEGNGADSASSAAGADLYVEKDSPEFHDLPSVVTRTVAAHRSRATSQGIETPTSDSSSARLADLERKLADATAALREAEQRHTAAMAAAAEQLAGRQLQYEVAEAGAVARWEVVDEQLRAATIEAASANQNYLAAAAKLDRLTQRESEISSQLAEAAAKNDALERRLVETEAAVEAAKARAEQERLDAAGQLAERQRELQALIDAERNRRAEVEEALRHAVCAREDAQTRHAAAMFDAAAQLRDLEAALRTSQHDHESSAAEVKRLSAREAELGSALADITASHANLERRVAATEAAFRDADARATRERLAATKKAAAREAELDAQVREEREARADLERTVTKIEAARDEAQQRHDAALAAAAGQLAEHQARFDRELSQASADRDRLTERVREVEGALAQARADHHSAAAEVERLTQREADVSSQLANVAARLADAEAARELVQGQLAEAIDQAAAREAELDRQLREERTGRADLQRALTEAEAARVETQQRHDEALAVAARELADHQARFDRELSETTADRDRLMARVRAVEGQLADATQKATAREAELDAQIREERSARADLQEALTAAETVRAEAQQQHEAALADAARALAEQQTRFDQEVAQSAAERVRLTERVHQVESVLAQARADHNAATADVARLTKRETDLTSQLTSEAARLAQVEAARQAAERQLAEAVSAHGEANDRAARERADAAARQADLEASLTREIETRQALEQTVAQLRAAAMDAERAFQAQSDRLRADARAQQERFDAQLGQARTEHQKQLTELQERQAVLARERDGLQQSLAAAQERSRQLDADLRAARVHLDEVGEAADAERRRLTAGLAESERRLDEARAEHQATVARLSGEHASVVSANRAEIQHLQDRLAAAARDLEATTERLHAVQAKADTVPGLRRELEESRAESGRLFQQAGLAMFRCTRNGEVKQANRVGMTLVGRRSIDELRGPQFATAVFEDPNALSWLIERCLSTRTRESIEATWRRKDGGRLVVRLSAYACAPEIVEIVAEDLTHVRVLQERLAQAHRMEAVGRLASEAAATCGNLLKDVHQQAQEWLMMDGTSAGSQHGQQLLVDVTRAAGLMRQLCAYGDEPVRTPALADLNTVIHDLEPVLKRVAGDAVDVQLPGTSSRLNVDVGAERVERLLVHLASYGRARMPFGGQLKIELGTTVVDRHFAAKHPNVRLGPHALITVTETKSTRRADEFPALRTHKGGPSSSDSPEQKPAVDFGTLHGLVGGCGGHLWMTVQPQGDMIAKIRLPLLKAHGEAAPRTLVARGGRALTRLFQH